MEDITLTSWLEQLAAKQPTPGGGGAAALAAAVSAGLIGMVCQYTTGEKWADRSQRMQAIADEAATLRTQAVALIQADAMAFAEVGLAYGLPRESESDKANRQQAIQSALVQAAEPPTAVAELATRLVGLAEELAPVGNPNVISDVAVAASQAKAAIDGAIINIEINAKLITDEAIRTRFTEVVWAAEKASAQATSVVGSVRERMSA